MEIENPFRRTDHNTHRPNSWRGSVFICLRVSRTWLKKGLRSLEIRESINRVDPIGWQNQTLGVKRTAADALYVDTLADADPRGQTKTPRSNAAPQLADPALTAEPAQTAQSHMYTIPLWYISYHTIPYHIISYPYSYNPPSYRQPHQPQYHPGFGFPLH